MLNSNSSSSSNNSQQNTVYSQDCPLVLLRHYQQLHDGSAISPEVINERKYATVLGTALLESLGFSHAQRRYPGILIPMFGVDGKPCGFQYKPDSPRLNPNGKPRKYENPPNQANRLDCPPRCQKQLADPKVPLWITEGIKKADCLASLGQCVVGITGIWNFRSKNDLGGITITADFDQIALNDREIYLCPDSDYATNASIRLAVRRLGGFLLAKKSKVLVVRLPQNGTDKVGVDDFVVTGHSTDEAKGLAEPLEQELENEKHGKEDNESYYPYLTRREHLYLEVIMFDGSYTFAYLNDAGEISLTPNVANGDKVIEPRHLPTKNGSPKAIVLMPSEQVKNTSLLKPDELYSCLVNHFNKYFDLAELDTQLCAYYALFTWFYPKVNTVGYLRFIGDTGKGKSRIQKVVADICFYPLFAAGASTFSGMARMQEKWRGTLVVDESDFQGEQDSPLIKFLNLGFEAGKYYIMSDKVDPKKQEIFDPFCPKIFSMRIPFQDNATEGRLMSIAPDETSRKDISIILPEVYRAEAQAIRDKIAVFALHHWKEIDGDKMFSFDDLDIEPRLKQLGMPLSIIFQVWPDGLPPFKRYLVKRQQEVKKTRSQSWPGTLFNLVLSIATGDAEAQEEFASYYDPQSKQIQAVTPSMISKQMKTTTKTVSQDLFSIGFTVEQTRITIYKKNADGNPEEQEKQVRAYVVESDQKWKEMIRRYYYDEANLGGVVEIPDILRSKKFVCLQASQVSHVSQTVEQQNLVTGVTDVTRQGTLSIKDADEVSPCPTCGSKRWWHTPDGDAVCRVCNPPPIGTPIPRSAKQEIKLGDF